MVVVCSLLYFGCKLKNIARCVCELKEENPAVWENFVIQMKENSFNSKILETQMEWKSLHNILR